MFQIGIISFSQGWRRASLWAFKNRSICCYCTI